VSLPTQVLRAAREGFGLPRGSVRVLSTRFGKVCLAHRAGDGTLTQLRLVRAQADTLARLDAETRWLGHLAVRHALRVPTPRGWHDGALVSPLLVDRDETRWHAIACRWVEGVHLDRGLRRTHFSAAGSLLAQLHRATADAPAHIAAARPTWWIPRLFTLATTLRDLVAGTVAPPPGVDGAVAAGLRDAATLLQQAHDALPQDAAHVGLVHTDAHWQNLRFSRRGVGLVDFEDFATGRFMIDIAALWGRVESRRDAAALLDAILNGYDRITPLPVAHQRDLRVMLAFRRFDYAGWVLSWPRLDLYAWGPRFLAGTPTYITRLLSS
jgi:Ser/Thr protein kinase RdoA (MazF antagonist)